MPRKLHLAVAVYGVGGPGQHGLWKDPRVPSNASTDINYYVKTAQVAEQALFDALFIVDSQFINATYPSHYLNRLEPLTLLSAVATHTSRIGLVATASSTYNSPFNLARLVRGPGSRRPQPPLPDDRGPGAIRGRRAAAAAKGRLVPHRVRGRHPARQPRPALPRQPSHARAPHRPRAAVAKAAGALRP
jgi:Luciferase-like monooxygenase